MESPRRVEKPTIDHATILKGMKAQIDQFREKWREFSSGID